MKFHLVKLLLFLSLAASFMLLLKEDISPVQDASCKEPRREWQWPMQTQCISYKACSRAPAPAEAEPRGTDCGRQGGAPRLWGSICCIREVRARGACPEVVRVSSTTQQGKRGLETLMQCWEDSWWAVVIINKGICASKSPWSWFSVLWKSHSTTLVSHRVSHQGAECLYSCRLCYFGAQGCLFCPSLLCKLSLIKIQQHTRPR